jgi:hypothetical protein
MTRDLEDKVEVGYNWGLTTDLGSGRTFVVQGNFPKGATKEQMDKEVDKVLAVANRQQAIASIPALEDAVIGAQNTYDATVAAINEAEARHEGTPLTSQQQADRRNVMINVEQHRMNVDRIKAELEKAKQLAV